MDEGDLREQISRLEVHIEELAEAIEKCRKIILISKAALAIGGALILAITFGAIRFDPTAMVAAITAFVGGIVLYGSNGSTLEQTMAALSAAEAQRTELIGRIELKIVAH
jgi:hypothetical protein